MKSGFRDFGRCISKIPAMVTLRDFFTDAYWLMGKCILFFGGPDVAILMKRHGFEENATKWLRELWEQGPEMRKWYYGQISSYDGLCYLSRVWEVDKEEIRRSMNEQLDGVLEVLPNIPLAPGVFKSESYFRARAIRLATVLLIDGSPDVILDQEPGPNTFFTIRRIAEGVCDLDPDPKSQDISIRRLAKALLAVLERPEIILMYEDSEAEYPVAANLAIWAITHTRTMRHKYIRYGVCAIIHQADSAEVLESIPYDAMLIETIASYLHRVDPRRYFNERWKKKPLHRMINAWGIDTIDGIWDYAIQKR